MFSPSPRRNEEEIVVSKRHQKHDRCHLRLRDDILACEEKEKGAAKILTFSVAMKGQGLRQNKFQDSICPLHGCYRTRELSLSTTISFYKQHFCSSTVTNGCNLF